MKQLALLGGGHAHLSVLEALAGQGSGDVAVTLITPTAQQNYSGMLPGWIAGHYTPEASQIDVQPLVAATGGQLILQRAVGMDAAQQCVTLTDGLRVHYDWLSIDVGSETASAGLEALGHKLLPVKPLDGFFARWPAVLAKAQAQDSFHLVVVGAGAAGVEITLAAHHALVRAGVPAQVDLIASEEGILYGHHRRVQERVLAYIRRAGVGVHFQRAAGTAEGVELADGQTIRADLVIAATGARAPEWLQSSGLSLNADGYIVVDAYHRSISSANVFAAGDVCVRPGSGMTRSGVHAVHAGPVLGHNLLAALSGAPLRAYRPRANSLYLLACGRRYAVASWGRWSAQGAWVWRWKDWIDRGFIRRFQRGDPAALALTSTREEST